MSFLDDDCDDHDGYVTEDRAEELFVAGAQAMREMLARFVDGTDAAMAASIRANWHPGWGKDPGKLDELPADWSSGDMIREFSGQIRSDGSSK